VKKVEVVKDPLDGMDGVDPPIDDKKVDDVIDPGNYFFYF
jgi:hypothetical protein